MIALRKALFALLITLLAYLTQVCVMPYLQIGGITGSVIFAAIAVLTVSCGKKYTFCSSLLIGMMMECMQAGINALYIIAYPAIAMLCAQFYADMSDRQRERRRTGDGKRRQDDLPALLRIPLCALTMSMIMSVILGAYAYLTGVDIGWLHIGRAFFTAVYTAAIAVAVMLPCRAMLGMYRRRRSRFHGGELY